MSHDPTWPPLGCTRCGGDLYIELIDEGSSWQSYRVVDSISCEKCGAEWDRNGKPKATVWLAENVGYHVTTLKKVRRYEQTGAILAPVRFWPNEETARRWMKRTGRTVLLQVRVEESYPLPDHKPARWTPRSVTSWENVS